MSNVFGFILSVELPAATNLRCAEMWYVVLKWIIST